MKLLVLTLLVLPLRLQAQGCTGYSKVYDITIPTSSVTGTLTAFTVMVQGTYSYLAVTGSGGFATSSSGYDVVFAKSGALLTWSMPRYISTTGEIRAKVLMTTNLTTTSATTFQMCVGNSGVTTFQGGSNPYDSNTQLAMNFTNASLIADDTGKRTMVVGSATYASGGPTHIDDTMGGGTMTGPDTNFPAVATSRHVSWWARPTSLPAYGNWFSYGSGSGTTFTLLVDNASKPSYYNGSGTTTLAVTSYVTNAWHRYDEDFSAPNHNFYIDGVIDKTTNSGLNTSLSGTLTISNGLPEKLANLKVATVSRNAAWIAAEYLNESNPDPGFYTIAAAGGTSVRHRVTH